MHGSASAECRKIFMAEQSIKSKINAQCAKIVDHANCLHRVPTKSKERIVSTDHVWLQAQDICPGQLDRSLNSICDGFRHNFDTLDTTDHLINRRILCTGLNLPNVNLSIGIGGERIVFQ